MDIRLSIDSGDIEEIKEAIDSGVVQGVATNPNKLALSRKSREEIIEEIRKFSEVPIAVMAVKTTTEEIIKEATYLSGLSKNIAVKIATNQQGIKAITELAPRGILTNATLIFSASQALMAGLAGSAYISPFVGRARDTGADGISVLAEVRRIYDTYGIKSKVIAASIKDVRQVIDSILVGADMVAVPYKVFKEMFIHPLTREGLDKFLAEKI